MGYAAKQRMALLFGTSWLVSALADGFETGDTNAWSAGLP